MKLKLLFLIILTNYCFASWTIFSPFSFSNVSTNENEILNYNFEQSGSSTLLENWNSFGDGYFVSSTSFSGTQSLKCVSSSVSEIHGAWQTVYLNQTEPKAIKLSGWSKAENVSGESDKNYSVYVDITYTNGGNLWGQTINFSVGTHDWEFLETVITPELPIANLNCYLLFRNSHTGSVWFDDIVIAEINESITEFDGEKIIVKKPDIPPFQNKPDFSLTDNDGLEINIASNGGTIVSLSVDSENIFVSNSAYASGWFVCDRIATSDWKNFGGTVYENNNSLVQQGEIPSLNLASKIVFSSSNKIIKCAVTVSNLIETDRAVSVYFALPVDFDGGTFWNTPNESEKISGDIEFSNLKNYGIGTRDYLNDYLLTAAAKTGGIAIAVPPDKYRPFRIIYNKSLSLFYIVFDVGISSVTEKFPNTASLEILFYRIDKTFGMRDGLEKYYKYFPEAFEKNYTNEGIWVAFADLSKQTNIADFHIAYHETSAYSHWKSDDTNSINSYRYLLEPWAYWMSMPTDISNTNYDKVVNYLHEIFTNGSSSQKLKAETVFSSGIRDKTGKLLFEPAAVPWCTYGVAFYLTASPFISDSRGYVTKFSNEWNETAKDTYNHPEISGHLDGEYMDSFSARENTPNYYSNYLKVTSFPLTYLKEDFTLMSPLIFGTYECAVAISADLCELKKPFIANGIYNVWDMPVGIGIFDFCGSEIDVFDNDGNFVYMADYRLIHYRAFSGRKPYGFLLNTDFTKVSNSEMELYMKLCAGYGIYPSAFSYNASDSNYWDQSWLYERDRELFKKYIPIIKAMNAASWQPVSLAIPDVSDIVLERFGTNSLINEGLFFSFRNLSSTSVSAKITFLESVCGENEITFSDLFEENKTTNFPATENFDIQFLFQPNETKIYSVKSIIPEPYSFINLCSFIGYLLFIICRRFVGGKN